MGRCSCRYGMLPIEWEYQTQRQLGRRSMNSRTSALRSEEHTSELQSLMRISYAVFCLKKKKNFKDKYNYDNKPHTHRDTPQRYDSRQTQYETRNDIYI